MCLFNVCFFLMPLYDTSFYMHPAHSPRACSLSTLAQRQGSVDTTKVQMGMGRNLLSLVGGIPIPLKNMSQLG